MFWQFKRSMSLHQLLLYEGLPSSQVINLNNKSWEITDMFLNHQDIKDICQYRNSKGAISLYVYSSTNETEREFRIRLNSLSDVIKTEAEKAGIKKRDLKALLRDIENIQRTLRDRFVENKALTYCVFLSDEFFKFVEIPVRVKDRALVDEQFYTLPLVTMLGQLERFAVLVFGRRSARLFNYYLGKLHEEESVLHDYVLPKFNASTGSWKCLREKIINHKIENSFHRHLKEVSRIVFENFRHLGFDRLILASHKAEIDSIKRHLHSYVYTRLAGEFIADVDDDIEMIKEKASKKVAVYRQNKEKTKISELFDSTAHSSAVIGVKAVLKALMTGNVRELICTDDLHTNGYICPEKHFITVTSTEGLKCVHCGRVLRKRTFLEDEIIEEAFAQRAEIFHLFYEKDKLEGHKIAAFLRFPIASNNIESVKENNSVFALPGPVHSAGH